MPLLGQLQGGVDVALLAGLVAANQQQHQFAAALRVVHPVSGAEIELHLDDTARQHPVLPRVAQR